MRGRMCPWRSKGKPRYHTDPSVRSPSNRGRVSINAEALEKIVREAALDVLADADPRARMLVTPRTPKPPRPPST